MSNSIKLKDKSFEIYLDEATIQNRVREIAIEINADYKGKTPIILCILNGSFIYTADLIRYFDFPVIVEFVRYSSYEGTESSGIITKILGLKTAVEGKDVIIVEDIIDTGFTISNAIKELKKERPASVKITSLLLKPDALQHDVHCDYVGFRIPNKFVVGYGLDYDELGRDLPSIYKLTK